MGYVIPRPTIGDLRQLEPTKKLIDKGNEGASDRGGIFGSAHRAYGHRHTFTVWLTKECRQKLDGLRCHACRQGLAVPALALVLLLLLRRWAGRRRRVGAPGTRPVPRAGEARPRPAAG